MRDLAEGPPGLIRVVFCRYFPFSIFTQTTNPRMMPIGENQKPKDLPFNDGSLGSRNDEERRETRYVM